MPELPEVETVKNQLLKANFLNKTISEAKFYWPKTLVSPSIKAFENAVIGQSIRSISRRAKYLIFSLQQHDLIIHLRMTGKFLITETKPTEITHERAFLKCGNIYLIFHDTRKFGTWQLILRSQNILGHLGTEPLSKEFSPLVLSSYLKKSKRPIKALLLDQTKIAGLGNIYVDESLWAAHISPTRQADSLSAAETKKLFKAIQMVLQKSIQKGGSSLGKGASNFKGVQGISGKYQTHFNVYQRDKLPCFTCNCVIKKIKLAQRGTHFCPRCQK